MRWTYRLRGWLMIPPMIFITLCTWRETEVDVLVWGLGGALFMAGVGMRLWAQRHLAYRLPVTKTLTATGPYAFVRNPIYLGNAAILVGACFLSELFWFAPVMLIYVGVVYSLVVRSEEKHLRAKYGVAYEDYVRRVPRWFSYDLFPSGAAEMPFRAGFWPSIRAELHNLLLFLPFIVKEILS